MIIMCKRNIIIPSPDGKTGKYIPKDYIGTIDKWVTETGYFKELVADGKVVVTESTGDKAIDKAAEAPVIDNTRKAKEKKVRE